MLVIAVLFQPAHLALTSDMTSDILLNLGFELILIQSDVLHGI